MKTTPKLGLAWYPRRSIEATYLPIMRCPVYRRRDSNPGSRMELENRVGDDKGKGTSGDPTRLKVPMHRSGAHCLVGARKRRNARGAIVSRRREQRHAVREMRVDPSEPPCRGRFQTAISCYGPMAAVVNVMVKRRDNLITSCGDERDECKRTAEDASKGHKWHQNRGVALPWEKHGGYLLTGHAVSGV